jgi:hypothetical protein
MYTQECLSLVIPQVADTTFRFFFGTFPPLGVVI